MVEPPTSPELHPRSRRRSWLSWYGQPKGLIPRDIAASSPDAGTSLNRPDRRHTVSFYDTGSGTLRAESGSRVSSRPSTPRSITAASISHFFSSQPTPHPPCIQVDQLPVPHDDPQPISPAPTSASANKGDRTTGSFGKMSFNSMLGGLSSLSLSRTTPPSDDRDKESRGRSSNNKRKSRPASFIMPSNADSKDSASVVTRTRSQSPFTLSRWRSRDREPSPTPLPLEESDSESFIGRRAPAVRPRTAFTDDPDSGSEYAGDETEDEDDDCNDDTARMYDTVTERNTEQNALIAGIAGDGSLVGEIDLDADAAFDPDPLGEGVNVVVPPEPYFPSTLNRSSFSSTRSKRGNPKRKKSRPHEQLPLHTSRPVFQRDRCTITIVQGDPDAFAQRKKTYVVASDLSDESRYAVEWGVGTVLRDGDEMYVYPFFLFITTLTLYL